MTFSKIHLWLLLLHDFWQNENICRHQMRSRTIALSYWKSKPFVKHLKSKYSRQIKEADLHLPREKSRHDQSWLPLSEKPLKKASQSRSSPSAQISMSRTDFHVPHIFPILFSVYVLLLFLPTAGTFFTIQSVIFFNYQNCRCKVPQ